MKGKKKGASMDALGHVKSAHQTQINHRQPPVGGMMLPRGTQPGSAAEVAGPPGGNVDRASAQAMYPATMPGDQKLKGGFNP
jgi:hypothetical protein